MKCMYCGNEEDLDHKYGCMQNHLTNLKKAGDAVEKDKEENKEDLVSKLEREVGELGETLGYIIDKLSDISMKLDRLLQPEEELESEYLKPQMIIIENMTGGTVILGKEDEED